MWQKNDFRLSAFFFNCVSLRHLCFFVYLYALLFIDGRGLQEVQINDKFAKLSETMHMVKMIW